MYENVFSHTMQNKCLNSIVHIPNEVFVMEDIWKQIMQKKVINHFLLGSITTLETLPDSNILS